MLYMKFIQLVEDHAEELTKQWIKAVKNNPATSSYNKMPEEMLTTRIYDLYKRLHFWILQNDPGDSATAEHYLKLGKERAAEKIKLSEVNYALLLSRVILWKYILNHGVISNSFDLQQAFEFYQKVINFYDKALYLVAVGYESYSSKSEDGYKKEEFIDKTISAVTKWLIR